MRLPDADTPTDANAPDAPDAGTPTAADAPAAPDADTRPRAAALRLPERACAVIAALEGAGFEAWAVGGCVRDMVRGAPFADVDIATSATCDEARRTLEGAGAAVFDSGVKHGTVTAVLGGQPFEITTYRADGASSDARHPDSVQFVRSIQEDLARRDFTVNAMAFHPDCGLVDPFGGQDDLERGVIRTVGDARERFREDALRILRACRFRAQLGFAIDAAAWDAMMRGKKLLSGLSDERVTAELTRLLCAPHAGDALMECVDVLSAVLPELVSMKGFEQRSPYHIYDVLEHTARVVDATRPDPLLRWAALLHDTGKPASFFMDEKGQGHFYGHPAISKRIAEGVVRRMRFRSSFEKRLIYLVEHHDDEIDANARCVKRALVAAEEDPELFRLLCELKRADSRGQAPKYHTRIAHAARLEEILDEVLREKQAFKRADLAIDGNDVVAAGVPRGPAVGAALQAALDEVIDGRLPNERKTLLSFVRTLPEATR